ncbi:MAG: TonB-dependent receptor, partial [Acidobacteriales bacterium]|nr:TonB-dependent receptor [Terriglobales bacterium]
MTKPHTAFPVCVVWLALACASFAQRASIEGEVRDRDAGLIPEVKVTLLNLDQGLRRETVSNAEGYFSVPLLQPGRYLVTAQKTGFAVAEIQDLVLHVGEVRGLKIQLQVSAAPIEIEVFGNAQAVETVSPALGQVVTGDVVRNAPLNGRDIRDLALLQPGVTPTDLDSSVNGVGTFNVAGGRSDSVNYLLDGGLNNDLIDNRAVYIPNPDTVSEFRILTSNYPAEFGRNSGGVVTIATQSGTKQLHGSVFDFLRNDALDANSFFNKNSGLPRNILKRNQFGGVLGGPLDFAKAPHSPNRVFFFVGYQGTREIQDLSEHDVPVFTPSELTGDFSRSGPSGGPDPNVAAYLQARPFFQSNPALAAQAIIDPSRINSVAANYIAANLLPTSPSGRLNSQQRFTLDGDELTTKLDFDLSANNKLAITVGGDRNSQFLPFSYADVPGFPDNSEFRDYFVNFAYTHIFRANLLNELRVTAERSHNEAVIPAVSLPSPAQLGIGITPDLPTGPTNLLFDTGLSIGFNTLGPQNFTDNTFSYSDAISWLHGKHSVKFGGGFSAFQNNTQFAFMVNGQFVFLGQGGIGSQNSFADFLLGLPLQFTQSANADSNIRSKFTYGFLQDDWHVRKNLTLSLGLRYEFSTPKSDTQGRTFSIVPGRTSQVFPNAPVGMVFPGDPGAPTGVNFPDKNDWAPRVGFAWDVNGKGTTSVRGAFGVFYDILKGEDNLQFNGQPPFYASAGFGFSPLAGNPSQGVNYLSAPFTAAGVANPFPSRPPPHDINFAAAGFLPVGASGSVFIVDPHLRTPYTYQYHLTLQHELAANTIFETSYVGNSSHGLTALQDINPFVLGTYNRVLNLTPGNSTCDSSTSFQCSFGFLQEFRNVAHANYNGLLVSLKKQYTNGGVFGRSYFTLAYTYSHNLDNSSGFENRNRAVPSYNPDLFYSAADMDIRNRVVFSGGWELPVEHVWK